MTQQDLIIANDRQLAEFARKASNLSMGLAEELLNTFTTAVGHPHFDSDSCYVRVKLMWSTDDGTRLHATFDWPGADEPQYEAFNEDHNSSILDTPGKARGFAARLGLQLKAYLAAQEAARA
jgi:hypothetical protein